MGLALHIHMLWLDTIHLSWRGSMLMVTMKHINPSCCSMFNNMGSIWMLIWFIHHSVSGSLHGWRSFWDMYLYLLQHIQTSCTVSPTGNIYFTSCPWKPMPFYPNKPRSPKSNCNSLMNMHSVATVGVNLAPLVFKLQDLLSSLPANPWLGRTLRRIQSLFLSEYQPVSISILCIERLI